MTSRWLDEEIVKEMGELPLYLTSDNFNVVISKLIQKPKIIFVDEIDIESIKKLHILQIKIPINLINVFLFDANVAECY